MQNDSASTGDFVQLDRGSVTEEVRRKRATQRAHEEPSGIRRMGERRLEYEVRRTVVKRRSVKS